MKTKPCNCTPSHKDYQIQFCPLHAAAPDLIQALRDGALVADLIRDRWESGDLAQAVRLLMKWRKAAIAAIKRTEARS